MSETSIGSVIRKPDQRFLTPFPLGITTDEVTFRYPDFHKPEGTLLCSRNVLPRDFTRIRIIGLIEDGKIDTAPWITPHLGFDDVAGEFEKYTRPETAAIKAIIDVSN